MATTSLAKSVGIPLLSTAVSAIGAGIGIGLKAASRSLFTPTEEVITVDTSPKPESFVVKKSLSPLSGLGTSLETPVRVAITGGSGQIGYALLFRIANGDMFGPNTPVHLNLLELPQAMDSLRGVEMELRDCAFPLLRDVVMTSDPEVAFADIDYAGLVGAMPRRKGMERGDLLMANANIFSTQGKALNKVAKGKDTRVVVVGNPANTNAYIASAWAPNIPDENFSAMTRLDHNRGMAQIAMKLNVPVGDIENFVIWGNHSATQVPDLSLATIKGESVKSMISDSKWVEETFTPCVQKRGAEIIAARGLSSAASAGGSLIDAIHDWHNGTNGRWVSAAHASNGEYGVEKGLMFSYPVTYENKQWKVVPDLDVDLRVMAKIQTTQEELIEERKAVESLLPK